MHVLFYSTYLEVAGETNKEGQTCIDWSGDMIVDETGSNDATGSGMYGILHDLVCHCFIIVQYVYCTITCTLP